MGSVLGPFACHSLFILSSMGLVLEVAPEI